MSNKPLAPDCEYLEHCVVWKRFNTDSKFVWIKRYCQGDKQSQCARKKLKADKAFVPEALLPSGEYLTPKGEATNECEKLRNCPVWKKFNADTKMLWIKVYCQGPSGDDCIRKQKSARGESVPDTLLPNGDTL